jgi:hypothetical protein
MRKAALEVVVAVAIFACIANSIMASTVFSFEAINFPTDTFTQLLGINNNGEVAGYHGSGVAGHPNQGSF